MDDSQANQRPSGDNQRARGTSVSVTACDQCYRCKVRCSGSRETCDRCLQNGSICTYSLGKPLGKPPKNGRGRALKNKTQPAKRLRCSTDDNDAQVDVFELPESPSPSSSGSGNGRKRLRLDEVQKLDHSNISISTTCLAIAEPLQAFASGTPDDTALLGFDMDMPLDLDLDLDMNFDTSHLGFFMDSPRPRTPALGRRHQVPGPIVTEISAIEIDADASGHADASLITPPSSLPSALTESSVSTQLWTPNILRIVSDLYSHTSQHSTIQRFDRTLLLARQGLDFVISCLPNADLTSPNSLSDTSTSTSPNSPLACVIIVQQVLASYASLKSRTASLLLSSNNTSSASRPTSASSMLPPTNTNEAIGEGVYIGSFEVEDLESQCHVMKAIVNAEIGRLRKVLIRLEEWADELSNSGKEEGKLAHLILVALKARLSASS